nr:MAG TPA: DnaJ-like protein [Crassvirales sp.]
MGINNGCKSQNYKIKNETELLEMFTFPDGIRAFMYVPFLHPVYNEVWATDGHVIIRINPDRLNKHYEPVEGCEKLKLPKVLKPCHLSCTYKAIRQALDACPLVDEVVTDENEEDCKECGGTGEVEWEYTDDNLHTHYHSFDCPVCGGSGVITHKLETHTGKKVHDEEAIVKIGKSFFTWFHLDIVAKALAHIGADVINITANDYFGMTEFEADGIKIGIMCYNSEGVKYNTEVELTKNGDEI